QHPEAALFEYWHGLAEELVRLGRAEAATTRARPDQPGLQRWEQPRRPPQIGQQALLRPFESAAEGVQGVPGLLPHALGGDDQARVVGGLEQELECPDPLIASDLGVFGR